MKCPYEKHRPLSVDGATIWAMLRMPVALKRAGMAGVVVGLSWQDLLKLAEAHGLEPAVSALLLQAVETKLVLAVNGEGGDDE